MKKKSEKPSEIKGLPKNMESLTVQKSRPMFALWRSEFSLAEFKILDMYLSRIDSHTPEKRTITLTKGELETALGVTRILKKDLKSRLRNLYNPIDLAEGDENAIDLVGLFERAEAKKDEDGYWTVNLKCTEDAMKYIFNLEDVGYLRYKLRSITGLQSRYSYVLFMYIEDNRFRKTWEVALDELKMLLKCDEVEGYNEFKIFNRDVLKRCQKEIQEKTECRFDYETVKKGRTVKGIKFTVHSRAVEEVLPAVPEEPTEETDEAPQEQTETTTTEVEVEVNPILDGQMDIGDFIDVDYVEIDDAAQRDLEGDDIDTLAEACDNEFGREDMELIYITLTELGFSRDYIERYDYLRKCYVIFKAKRAEKAKTSTPVVNARSYFISVLKTNLNTK